MIKMTGITKDFDNNQRGQVTKVLRGIDLAVEKGELLAIKGPSGAGKSTLLHILGCLDQPTTGQYLLDGELVSSLSLKKLAGIRNHKIGFVMQHFSLIEEDSVLENVGVPLLFGKTKMSSIDDLALNQLAKLDIAHLAKKRVNTLSGGEKQRVAIARALVNNPEIILADEPTGALDAQNSAMVMDILSELNNQGKTIIIVTHEDMVSERCKRVVTISDGQLYEMV
ncbi:ABC transporter ATP-binding protein [Clostridiales bacterium FE2010]|nr:ABC transporter ATP-binding protein [Clostridiales bacterium FE2010]